MAERDASLYLEDDIFLLALFTIEHGEMTGFVLQLEIYDEMRWHPVIRYDSTHGEAHIDYIDPRGREYNKIWLGVRAPFDTIYRAIHTELKSTYRAHAARWNRQKGRRR
ncbi:MAG: hypothetical protein WBA46_17670 [Thermomicrobiales bacterium]